MSLHGGNQRTYYLCTHINGNNPNKVMLYYSKNAIILNEWVNCEELKEAHWLVSNRFHKFCLWKITEILKNKPTQEELLDDQSFQLYFNLCTQFRVYRAVNEQFAIDRTYDIVNKILKDKHISQEKKEQLVKNHKKLIDEFNQSIEHHFMAS